MWVAASAALARINLEKSELSPALEGKSDQYEILCPSHSGGWWIQTAGRIRLWRDGQWLADAGGQLWPDGQPGFTSLEDHEGHLWVGTLYNGLFCYNTNGPAQHITKDNGLGSDLINTLFEDAGGSLWVGTRAGGLNQIRSVRFRAYTRQDGLTSDQVSAVCEGANGELWVGTDGAGLNRLKDGVVTHFGSEQGLSGRFVHGLVFDRQGVLWVGTLFGGLFKFEQDHFVAQHYLSGSSVSIGCLFEDSQSRLWVGQQRSLNSGSD